MSDSAEPTRGLVDTNILIHRARIDVQELPDEFAISAITLAELAAGVHMAADNTSERAIRVDTLQRAESEFSPFPFDADCARMYGRLCAAVQAGGRTPRRRVADLMIAATAAVTGLPLYTTNPDDYRGLDGLVDVRAVNRPVFGASATPTPRGDENTSAARASSADSQD